MKTPIAFFVFNRPDTTAAVFARIAEARPERLFVVSDGPRSSVPGEAERCAEVLGIVSRVDWPCRVERSKSDVNLGCGRRVSSGLDWVFAKCEEAVVLEDDCLPAPSFFRFAEELLERYRQDERIGAIGGCNFGAPHDTSVADYCFTRYPPPPWGWATWRRVWRRYDFRIPSFDPALYDRWIDDEVARRHFRDSTGRARLGELDTWDFQLAHVLFEGAQLSVVPTRNLVTNLGLGRRDATHTSPESASSSLRMPLDEVSFPLRHPAAVAPSAEAERYVEDFLRSSARLP
jgi:hypothetical protein